MMALVCLTVVQEKLWKRFSPFFPSVIPPHKVILYEGGRYNILVLALPLLGL